MCWANTFARSFLLDGGIRSGRRSDELGAAAVHRLARHAFPMVPAARLEFLRIRAAHHRGAFFPERTAVIRLANPSEKLP